jgi:hypothetical protein
MCDDQYDRDETLRLMRWMYERQFPPDCKKAKLYVMRYSLIGMGIGSVIHVLGAGSF